MTANDSKSYFAYLNKLVDKYNNSYHRIIGKKAVTADYSTNNQTNPKATKFKVSDRVRITKYMNTFNNVYNENWSREIFIIDLNGEKIIEILYETELLLSKL